MDGYRNYIELSDINRYLKTNPLIPYGYFDNMFKRNLLTGTNNAGGKKC